MIEIDENGMPNFMIVPDNQEKPHTIIENYYDIILYAIQQNDYDSLMGILEGFFDDVNLWTVNNMLIQQAKATLLNLQMLHDAEHEFIDDGFDDEISND